MKKLLIGIVGIAAALSFVGANCNPQPQPPPNPDASDAAPTPPPVPGDRCAAACAALKAASCGVIGSKADCPTFLARDYPDDGSGKLSNPATGRPMRCTDIAAVQTKADAQRLGFVCQ